MDPLERYRLVVDQIKREEQIVSSRLSWILGFEGFLFASISFLLKESTIARDTSIIAVLIAMVGISVCILGIFALWASAETKDRIKNYWRLETYWEDKSDTPDNYPPFHGLGKSKIGGRSLSYGIPVILIIFWFLVIGKVVFT